MSTATTVLKQFYGAVQQRDMKAARECLADDMVFVGLFETYPNADAYIATFTQLMQIVVRLDVKAIFGDEGNAAIFMDMVTGEPVNATTLVAEWHQVRDGKIVRAQSAFDGQPFVAMFMQQQSPGASDTVKE
jgi:ketosteroid isomerase-like protein